MRFQIEASLTVDSRGIIYYRNAFIIQATGGNAIKTLFGVGSLILLNNLDRFRALELKFTISKWHS